MATELLPRTRPFSRIVTESASRSRPPKRGTTIGLVPVPHRLVEPGGERPGLQEPQLAGNATEVGRTPSGIAQLEQLARMLADPPCQRPNLGNQGVHSISKGAWLEL